jgi:hypothetical protein
MADNTGAPWLLPYPESTDLVRDGAQDIEALATAVASGLTAANTGIGTNVVQAVKTNVLQTASDVYIDIPGLSATITPSKDTSKVLVLWSVDAGSSQATVPGAAFILLTDGSNNVLLQGDVSGDRQRVTAGFALTLTNQINNYSGSFLWSPGTASAVTAKLRTRRFGGNVFINRVGDGTDADSRPVSVSTLTLIEVAV